MQQEIAKTKKEQIHGKQNKMLLRISEHILIFLFQIFTINLYKIEINIFFCSKGRF
jgi:hypothetical protein